MQHVYVTVQPLIEKKSCPDHMVSIVVLCWKVMDEMCVQSFSTLSNSVSSQVAMVSFPELSKPTLDLLFALLA